MRILADARVRRPAVRLGGIGRVVVGQHRGPGVHVLQDGLNQVHLGEACRPRRRDGERHRRLQQTLLHDRGRVAAQITVPRGVDRIDLVNRSDPYVDHQRGRRRGRSACQSRDHRRRTKKGLIEKALSDHTEQIGGQKICGLRQLSGVDDHAIHVVSLVFPCSKINRDQVIGFSLIHMPALPSRLGEAFQRSIPSPGPKMMG